MNNCVFCSILDKISHAYIIYEDGYCLAFLDNHPVFLGHTLLIPKKHNETFYDIPSNKLKRFFQTAQHIGKAVEIAMKAEGTFIAMNNRVSQRVPHAHLHIIPRSLKDGLIGFFWPRQKLVNERMMREVCKKIQKTLKKIETEK